MWIVPVLSCVFSVFLFTASCSKQTVKADLQDVKDAAKKESASAASAAAASSSAPASVVQKAPESVGSSAEDLAAKAKAAALKSVVNEDVFFDYDSAVLSAAAQDVLKNKSVILGKYSGVSVTIEGHCDERGTNEYNLALGERRAESAKSFLVSLGVNPSRLKTISYGEEKPVNSGNDEAAWSKNRRAHFVTE
ncbi:MAG: peptidoglycan-associated lipoprotein Pal [Desulfobacteraceae bacterium]|nr:MAG: peptidoglycan-associated lipoprotein Pal [Desulfobacteraceae bacterium]